MVRQAGQTHSIEIPSPKSEEPGRGQTAQSRQDSTLPPSTVGEKFPASKDGFLIVRDKTKRFVRQIPQQQLQNEILKAGWSRDYEILAYKSEVWIPLEDLASPEGDESRVK